MNLLLRNRADLSLKNEVKDGCRATSGVSGYTIEGLKFSGLISNPLISFFPSSNVVWLQRCRNGQSV